MGGAMSVSLPLGRFLAAPPLSGNAMAAVAVAAVAAPTALRFVMDASQGDGFCPYLPFVAVAALVLNWRAAAAVAVVSGLLADYLFEGARFQIFEAECEITGLIFFCLASVLVIGLAQALRKAVADPLWFEVSKPAPRKLIFSRKAGQACV